MISVFLQFAVWLFSITIAALVTALITRWIQLKVRVICYIGQTGQFSISGKDGPIKIATHSLVIRNNGNQSAKNLQVIHKELPDFNINPQTDWIQKELPNGLKSIVFPNFVPKDQVTISYLYDPQIWNQIHISIKHDDEIAKIIKVLPVRIWPQFLIIFIWLLAIVGFITILYGSYIFMIYLLN